MGQMLHGINGTCFGVVIRGETGANDMTCRFYLIFLLILPFSFVSIVIMRMCTLYNNIYRKIFKFIISVKLLFADNWAKFNKKCCISKCLVMVIQPPTSHIFF